jgi:hypothetical protein
MKVGPPNDMQAGGRKPFCIISELCVAALQHCLVDVCMWSIHMSLVDSSMESAPLLACINPPLLPLL